MKKACRREWPTVGSDAINTPRPDTARSRCCKIAPARFQNEIRRKTARSNTQTKSRGRDSFWPTATKEIREREKCTREKSKAFRGHTPSSTRAAETGGKKRR